MYCEPLAKVFRTVFKYKSTLEIYLSIKSKPTK